MYPSPFGHNFSDDPSDPDQEKLAELADRYLDRLRAGEDPDIEAWVREYPPLAPRLREILIAMRDMEEVVSQLGSTDESPSGSDVPDGKSLENLPPQLGPYEIVGLIGRGGMGLVYEARHRELKRNVALKVLHPNLVRQSRYRERFRREAQAAGSLHHPNIVPIYEVGHARHVSYIAMQLIRGPSLDAVINDLRELRQAWQQGREAPAPVAHRLSPWSADSQSSRPPAPKNNSANPVAEASAAPSQALNAVPTPGTDNDVSAVQRATGGVVEPAPVKPAEGAETKHGNGGSDSSAAARSTPTWDATWRGSRYFLRVARLMLQAADAIDYAHRQQIVHRDLKPSNMMLDERGTLVITDFGLAKLADSELTGTQDAVGTYRYMAPEQFHGWSDARSDVYSLGMTLYELLTLQPTFRASNHAELVQKVLNSAPEAPRRCDPKIPRDLETIYFKATAREPSLRYASAAELRDDLQRFVERRPIMARRNSVWQQLSLWTRRQPILAFAAALLAVSLCGWFISLQVVNRNLKTTSEEMLEIVARLSLREGAALISRGNPQEVTELLAQVPDGKWSYLQQFLRNHIDQSDAIVGGSAAATPFKFPVLNAVVGSDHLAVVSPYDGGAEVWNWKTQKRLRRLTGFRLFEGYDMAVTPDGRYVICSQENSVRVWDLRTGEGQDVVNSDNSNWTPRVSRDSRYVLTAGNGHVLVTELATARVVARYSAASGEFSSRFDAHDSEIVWMHDGRDVHRWHWRTDAKTFVASASENSFWQFYGEHIAVLEVRQGPSAPTLWRGIHLPSQRTIWELPLEPYSAVVVAPDEQQVAIPSELGKITLISNLDGTMRDLIGHQGYVRMVSFDPTGRWLVSCGLDRVVRIWDTQRPRHRVMWRCWNPNIEAHYHTFISNHSQFVLSADQRRLVSYHNDAVRVFNAQTLELLRTIFPSEYFVTDVGLSTDGEQLATASDAGELQLWNATTGAAGEQLGFWGHAINSPALSADGRWLGLGDELGDYRLINTASGESQVLHRDTLLGGAFAFRPQSEEMVFGGLPMNIYWMSQRTDHGPKLLSQYNSSVLQLTFSPDGRYLAGLGRGTQIRWHDMTAPEVPHNWTGHVNSVIRGQFTGDSQAFVSVGHDGTLRFWTPGNAAPLATLEATFFPATPVSIALVGSREPEQAVVSLENGVVEHLIFTKQDAPAELLRNAQLLSRVQWWFAQSPLLEDVLAHLRNDPFLQPADRQRAEEIARRWRGSPDNLYHAAWKVLAQAERPAAEYALALRHASATAAFWPDKASGKTLHGVALYRCGDYPAALAEFTAAHALWLQQTPVKSLRFSELPRHIQLSRRWLNHVFWAATLHRLGREAEARDVWEQGQAITFRRDLGMPSAIESVAQEVAQQLGVSAIP